MSSAPLLGSPGPQVMQDHPVFLRASHSPWRYIPQNVLVVLRGLAAAFLVGSTAIVLHYKLTDESESDKPLAHLLFDFSFISQAMALVYHLLTFSWTFTHLYYPVAEEIEGGIEEWIVRAMSLPRNMSSQRNQFYFTIYYSTAVVFAFMNSIIYWFVTRQHEPAGGAEVLLETIGTMDGDVLTTSVLTAKEVAMASLPKTPFSDLLGEGWFKLWALFNLHGASSLIMTLEVLFFNSIKATNALGFHFIGIIFNSGLYLA